MASKTVTVGSSVGLHARPAATIAEAAAAAAAPVTLAVAGGEPVDAGSSLLIMTLGAGPGTEITVESPDEGVMEQIAALVAADLDA
ncbi:MAG: HPr family phosphocarrier protein [Actinomycetales bacterium]|nr:MAG: HPr family phosphocarrier protein [Actinomycetales bacterium]